MSDVGKKIIKGLKEAVSGKPLMLTVFCPHCGSPKRLRVRFSEVFGLRTCAKCKGHWIPPPSQEQGLIR